jgi:hypothetical protein
MYFVQFQGNTKRKEKSRRERERKKKGKKGESTIIKKWQ